MNLSTRTRQRLVIVGLFGIFMVPILFALALNLPGVHWLPFGMRNHGDLLQPPPSLAELSLTAVDGGVFGARPLEQQWSLLLTASAPCSTECASVVEKMLRARLALGEHGGRLQLIWLVTDDAISAAEVEQLAGAGSVLRVARLTDGMVRMEGITASPTPVLHVVDPNGYAVLRFRGEFTGRDLLKDLERLLRYSKEP